MKTAVCIFLFFTVGYLCSFASASILDDAPTLFEARECEKLLSLQTLQYSDYEQEKQRLLYYGLALVWLERWDEAADTMNALLVHVLKQEGGRDIYYAIPAWLKDNPGVYQEFKAVRFNQDDMRYLWRVLWQDRIATRIAGNAQSPMKKTVALLDYVFRHCQFGKYRGIYIQDPPMYSMIRGHGMCEELSWNFDQFLRASGLKALRLILYDTPDFTPSNSPHTISLVQTGKEWVPIDPSYGMILKGSNGVRSATFPANFLHGAKQEDITAFGTRRKPVQPFIDFARRFPVYENLADAFMFAIPIPDDEWEAHTARFLALHLALEEHVPLPSLASPFRSMWIPIVKPGTTEIERWISPSVPQIWNLSAEKKAEKREQRQELFGNALYLRDARLAQLNGELERAEEIYQQALKDESLHPDYREDVLYFLAVTAFEREQHKIAHERFQAFLKRYPASGWKDRALYQLARIEHQAGNAEACEHYLKKCGQDTEVSLFRWVTRD